VSQGSNYPGQGLSDVDKLLAASRTAERAMGQQPAFGAQPAAAPQPGNGDAAGAGLGGTGAGVFSHPRPGGDRTLAAILGEVVWLLSQSPKHKGFLIADLEWMVMTPVLLTQYRLYYAQDRPIGVVLWAAADAEVEERLAAGSARLRPQDWKSGDRIWVADVIAPFGGDAEMLADLKAKVFPDRDVKFLALGERGRGEVKVI
jgi:cytolysin-activating lysine-acyltransferase